MIKNCKIHGSPLCDCTYVADDSESAFSVLLDCPFCGGKPVMKDLGSSRYHIKCPNCPARFGEAWGSDETEDYLCENWNRRAI